MLGAGAKLLFHALAAGVAMRDEHSIDALIVETKSGRRGVRGRVFVDASGDGELACWAGAPWEKGDAAGRLLYPTLMFRVNNVDAERARDAVKDINRLMQEAEARGEHRFPRKGAIVRPQKHPGEWRANVTQLRNADGSAVDGTDALQLSAGEIEGRRQIRDTMRFLRRRVPGFESSYLLDIAPQLGIRETRRVVGHAMLAAEDVLGCASFPDTVGVNAWPPGHWSAMSRATSSGAGRRFPNCAASITCLTACGGAAHRQPARRRTLRIDDFGGAVGCARLGRLLRHGTGGRHGGTPRPFGRHDPRRGGYPRSAGAARARRRMARPRINRLFSLHTQ